jgi:hypothetical protein
MVDYYMASLPRGYELLYWATAPIIDPRVTSKLLPYAQLAVFMSAMAAAAWRLAGPAAAWGTASLCLSTDVYLARMDGGLPRSFGFPLVALAVLALLRGKPRLLGALTVLSVGLYYQAAVLIGVVTALYLLVLPAAWRGEAKSWSFGRRSGALGLIAAATAVLALPPFLATRRYGPPIGRADVERYPEAGLGGRYGPDGLPLRGNTIATVEDYSVRPLLSNGPPMSPAARDLGRSPRAARMIIFVIVCIAAVGYARLFVADTAARRLLLLPIGGLCARELALAVWPWALAPERYVIYGFFPLAPIVVPAAAAALFGARSRQCGPAAFLPVLVVVAATVLLLGGSGPGHDAISVSVPAEQHPLHSFISRLPAGAVIAGWPDDVIDDVPYVAGKNVLIGFEMHQALHRRYADEMRRRMFALIDAYFATDVEPLHVLRRDFGVTHLILNRDYYAAATPSYFKPFDVAIRDALTRMHEQPETLRQAGAAAVFDDGRFVVLDLARVVGGAF